MEFRLLGPLEVVRDGEPLVLRAAKHRSLLALLLLHANELVSYERMFDELWGDSPPATARTTLQVYVSGLRKALGSERIVSNARGYELRTEEGEVDAARFERLLAEAREQVQAGAEEAAAERYRQALALWRGFPRTRFVAGFFRGCNVLEARLERDGRPALVIAGHRLPLAKGDGLAGPKAVAVRGESLMLADQAREADLVVPARLEKVTYRGIYRDYRLRLDDGQQLSATLTQRLPLAEGSRIEVGIRTDEIVLLEED